MPTISLGHEKAVRVPGRLRRVVDADDLRQEASLRMLRGKAADFEGRTRAERETYVRRSLASALIDTLRYESRARRSGERAEVPVEDVSADWTSPSRKAVRNEQLARLAEALTALPDDQRMAVNWHYIEGRTLAETAAEMDRTLASVAGLIRRGLEALRQRLVES